MNIKRYQAFMLAIAIACPLMLSSCTAGTRRTVPSQPGTTLGQNLGFRGTAPGTTMGGTGGTNMGITGRTGTTQNVISADGTRGQRLTSELKRMKELSEVNVLVSGNTALVGYKPYKTTANTTALKNRIITRVKQLDPAIKTVAASENADIVSSIKKMSNDVVNNRNTGNIANEVKRLLSRISPMVK